MSILGIANGIFQQFTGFFIWILINHGLAADARQVVDSISDGGLRGKEVVQARFGGRWQRVVVVSDCCQTFQALESTVET